jgi:hypothetical protein
VEKKEDRDEGRNRTIRGNLKTDGSRKMKNEEK